MLAVLMPIFQLSPAREATPMDRRRGYSEGFTLIEIMVVILILGLLATIVVQSLRGATDKAKRTKADADISEIKTALDRYYLDRVPIRVPIKAFPR
jgi:prepilin-type N-terminal cleavage/methylation domain-containing protein